MRGEQVEHQFQLLQSQHVVFAEHVDLRGLAGRLLFQKEALGVAFGLPPILRKTRGLHRDLRGDEVALLVGGGAGLLGLLPLLLGDLLLDIGGAKLPGQLLALARQQQFRRDRRFAEPDLLDVDARAPSVDLRPLEDRLFEHAAVFDRVEHAGRPRDLPDRPVRGGFRRRDGAAIDVAHERTDRGHDDALVDLVLTADRRDDDRGVFRRDLNDRAQLLRDFPPLDLGVDRGVDGVPRLGKARGALGLGKIAAGVDLEVDIAAGEAALELQGRNPRGNQGDVVGVAVEVVIVGRQGSIPHALAVLRHQLRGEAAVVGFGGARLAIDARGLDG